jgi:hypothetical protein
MGRIHKVQGKACEVCGESREQCFEVHLGGQKHVFDSFECAMRGLMPKCALCGCLILGPGVQDENISYCSHLCANTHRVYEYETRILVRERANL